MLYSIFRISIHVIRLLSSYLWFSKANGHHNIDAKHMHYSWVRGMEEYII